MVIPKADFGRTGHKSTRVIFGAASLGNVSQKVADETLEVLLRHGVNHIDTAASYGDSELRIAPWLKREPGRFFLATKVDQRDEKGAREQLDRSLDRLGVDHVDLWQLHSLADPIEWDQALSDGGALDEASRDSISTRSCCRATSSRCKMPTTARTSTRWWQPARSDASPFRPSSRLRCVRGCSESTREPRGTSRWSCRTTSTSPCRGCWPGPEFS